MPSNRDVRIELEKKKQRKKINYYKQNDLLRFPSDSIQHLRIR